MGVFVWQQRRYELSDAQWERIKDMIPRAENRQTAERRPFDVECDALAGKKRRGPAGHPERYGPHQSVYSRFCKWRDDGTLLRIFLQALNADADYENLCIDSTSIKAHPQSAGAKKGL